MLLSFWGEAELREEVIIKSSKFRDWEAKSTLPGLPHLTQGARVQSLSRSDTVLNTPTLTRLHRVPYWENWEARQGQVTVWIVEVIPSAVDLSSIPPRAEGSFVLCAGHPAALANSFL